MRGSRVSKLLRSAAACASSGALVLAAVAAPAAASTRTITIRPLMLMPTSGTAAWSAATLLASSKTAARFWEQATGSALRFTVRPVAVRTSASLRHCGLTADKALAKRLFGITTEQASTIYVIGNPLSTCKRRLGEGEFGGRWLSVQSADPGIIAHELGHNLGLKHAGASSCPLPKGTFGLTSPGSNCAITEYGDSDDIMGNNFDVQLRDVGLSAASLALLRVAQPRVVTAASTFTLEPLEQSRQSLAVQTQYGRAYIEYGIGHKGTLFGDTNDHTVQIRIAGSGTSKSTTHSIQLWVYRDPLRSGDADGPYLYPGDQVKIPGSQLQMRIGAMDASGADVAFASAADPTPLAPPAPSDVRRDAATLRYTFSPAADHSGFVYFAQTLSGPRIIGSARGTASTWQVPASVVASATVGVATISTAGATSDITWQTRSPA